jgi:hypothetical protein
VGKALADVVVMTDELRQAMSFVSKNGSSVQSLSLNIGHRLHNTKLSGYKRGSAFAYVLSIMDTNDDFLEQKVHASRKKAENALQWVMPKSLHIETSLRKEQAFLLVVPNTAIVTINFCSFFPAKSSINVLKRITKLFDAVVKELRDKGVDVEKMKSSGMAYVIACGLNHSLESIHKSTNGVKVGRGSNVEDSSFSSNLQLAGDFKARTDESSLSSSLRMSKFSKTISK